MSVAGLSFSAGTLLAGLVFGVFGIFIFRQGKREANFRRLLLGFVLLAYGFFVTNPWVCWGIGFALLGVNYFTGWVEPE